ncbi:MAG: LamG-like jellyroll fold domain-containing protein [Thermoguttaceae bacterium]
MSGQIKIAILLASALSATASDAEAGESGGRWWNGDWRFRTTVARATPWRDDRPRPVEAAIDLELLLERAGIAGQFDPGSVRVIEPGGSGAGREIPAALRSEIDAGTGLERSYVAWIAEPGGEGADGYEIYFDTADRGLKPQSWNAELLPPENLAFNAGFEDEAEGLPAGWTVRSKELVRLGEFRHTTGRRSFQVVVDENTPAEINREVSLAQHIDVRRYVGQEMVFECDLLAERAAYGAPVSIELEQFRGDGSRIAEYAVEPRWLTIELAAGQLVQFRERGRFHPEAATVTLRVRMRCTVRDADTRELVTGPDSCFTIWLDRIVVRPGERWPWPAETGAGFVEGALEEAPLNRGFEFTGSRRLAFNGASEGELTGGKFRSEPRSVHWGLERGTLEFWCRPVAGAEDPDERIFFDSVAYGHRPQCRFQQRQIDGRSQLEFMIADTGGNLRTVRGPATLEEGKNHHLAATWDFPKAHLQLFVSGKRIGEDGPHPRPWPSSLTPDDPSKAPGTGIMELDRRSMPMQAFIGGDKECDGNRGAEAVLDELRISDAVRYQADFAPSRREFDVDEHTRALFHFENERDGIHDWEDRRVRGHMACELPRQQEGVLLETWKDGGIERRTVLVRPWAPAELFEKNRAENRLTVTRPQRELPDPRFVEYRGRQVERTVREAGEEFVVNVGGDYEPLMGSIAFERAGPEEETTGVPHWRANGSVVPFSAESLAETLAEGAKNHEEKALEVLRYALAISNYYDANFCETLPTRHRERVSYTLLKAVNIYAFDQCGPLNHTLRKLFLAAGISSNDASGTHHQFEQAFYGGQWRLFDLSPRKYWLDRDNASVASRRTFEEDLYLKLRQGDGVTSGLQGRVSRATFGSAEREHPMDLRLRPGERASLCWHNEGRWFEITGDRQPVALSKVPPYFGNGAVLFEPTGAGEAAVLENAEIVETAAGARLLRARNGAEAAAITYRASCPYLFSDATVSGVYRADSAGAVTLWLSLDEGKSWKEAWRNAGQSGPVQARLLDDVMGRYAYWVKLELAAGSGAAVENLTVRSTLVASPLALPGKLSRGENRIATVGDRLSVPVRTTCRWIERYRSELGVSLSAIRYYLGSDEAQRNLVVATPEGETRLEAAMEGGSVGHELRLVNLPQGWTSRAGKKESGNDAPKAGGAVFTLRPEGTHEGDVETLDLVVGGTDPPRRVTMQVLVARAALVSEAEEASACEGEVATTDLGELSGARGVLFRGEGRLVFELASPAEGKYALWLRARWEPGSSTAMTLAVGDGKLRKLQATAMIGFSDWSDPRYAHTKMFAHFGEQYGHWAWYRVPDVALEASDRRLTLGAEAGAFFDAILLLPENPSVDRAAMNLLQNWNYSPWLNPL